MLNNWVDDFSKPINEISECKNVYEKNVWALTKVPWYTAIWTTGMAWLNVTKLHYYHRPSTWVHYMLWCWDWATDQTIKYRTTWAWSTVTTLSWRANTELSMVNFLDKTFVVWYREYTSAWVLDRTFDTPATIKWTDYITSTTTDPDLTWMPQWRFITKYNDRLAVAHVKIWNDIYPSRVYFSDIPVAMAIPSWNSSSFEDFGFQDWDMIMWIWEIASKLTVLKNSSIWTMEFVQWETTDLKKVANIGCISDKSVTIIHWAMYWLNKDWVWRYSGWTPQLISRKVQKFIDSMTNTNFVNAVGTQYENEYRVFVWEVTVDWYLYSNTWLCFDMLKETWYIRCTAHPAYSSVIYTESWEERTYFWTVGKVEKFAVRNDNVFSDDWYEIDSFAWLNYYHFDLPSVVKHNPAMTIYTNNPQWMKLVCETESIWTKENSYSTVLRNNIEQVELWATWNYFKFKFYEKSLNKPWTLKWFTVDIKELEERH